MTLCSWNEKAVEQHDRKKTKEKKTEKKIAEIRYNFKTEECCYERHTKLPRCENALASIENQFVWDVSHFSGAWDNKD